MDGTNQTDTTTEVTQAEATATEHQSVADISKATPDDEPVKITIIIPTNAYFMSGLRDFTMNVVRNMTGFSEQWAFRFQSVVDELVNNAIEFGSSAGQDVHISFVPRSEERVTDRRPETTRWLRYPNEPRYSTENWRELLGRPRQ